MVVKFLAKSKTYKGVRYNTSKVNKGTGELMKVSCFGPLQDLPGLLPADYINYLELVSSRSKRTVYPQFHAMISAKGKSVTGEQLTGLATRWMEKMGYGDQPYLVVFHKDTKNHHVHIVSTRVDVHSGKKINSAFEHLRAQTEMNRVLRQDEFLSAGRDLEQAMAYNYSTRAQLMMILESRGYILKEDSGKLKLIRFGKVLAELAISEVADKANTYRADLARARQLRAILAKYKDLYLPELSAETVNLPGERIAEKATYASDLSVFLRQKFGLELVFHGKPGKPPYGYTVIDHAEKNVFKGGELMDLAELLAVSTDRKYGTASEGQADFSGGRYFDEGSAKDDLDVNLGSVLAEQPPGHDGNQLDAFDAPVVISISDDIDDEDIHGRNRRRRRQARTNSR